MRITNRNSFERRLSATKATTIIMKRSRLQASLLVCCAASLCVEGFSPERQQPLQRRRPLTSDGATISPTIPTTTTTTIEPTVQETMSPQAFWSPILSSSLFLTCNTVGAGCLVLPERAAGIGLPATVATFAGAYLVNLASGWVLAERARESRATSLQDCVGWGPVVSGVSLAVNACLVAFATLRAAEMAESPAAAVLWMMGVAALTQQDEWRTNAANICTVTLFGAFAGLVLNSGSALDLQVIWNTPGDGSYGWNQVAPVVYLSMVYQNIIPTIVQSMNRLQTGITLAVGSALPLTVYLVWCTLCLGGGVSLDHTELVTVFSLATLAGSSLGSGTSLTKEVETMTDLPTVSILLVPLLAALAIPDQVHEALTVAGTYGSPLLYAVLPAILAFQQSQDEDKAF